MQIIPVNTNCNPRCFQTQTVTDSDQPCQLSSLGIQKGLLLSEWQHLPPGLLLYQGPFRMIPVGALGFSGVEVASPYSTLTSPPGSGHSSAGPAHPSLQKVPQPVSQVYKCCSGDEVSASLGTHTHLHTALGVFAPTMLSDLSIARL